MKKSIQLIVHLPFWIFTSLLVILTSQLLSLSASILGGGGPSFSKQFSVLLIVLPIGASIFYASYFSLPFFVKRATRLIWLSIGYVPFIIILGLIDYCDSKHIDFFGLFLVLLPIFYFNGFGFLFRTFIEWIKDRKIKAELEKDKVTSQLEFPPDLPIPAGFCFNQILTLSYFSSPFSTFAPFGPVAPFPLCAAGIKPSKCTLTVGFLLKWGPPNDDSLDTSSSTSRCSVFLSMVLALRPYIELSCTFSKSLTALGLKKIPVIVLTTSSDETDIFDVYNLHANCYIVKPLNFNEYSNVPNSIIHFWFTTAKTPRAYQTSGGE